MGITQKIRQLLCSRQTGCGATGFEFRKLDGKGAGQGGRFNGAAQFLQILFFNCISNRFGFVARGSCIALLAVSLLYASRQPGNSLIIRCRDVETSPFGYDHFI